MHISHTRARLTFYFSQKSINQQNCSIRHISNSGKTYYLFFIEVHQLAPLFTSAHLSLKQDLPSNFHRSPSISKSILFRTTRIQVRLTFYFHKSPSISTFVTPTHKAESGKTHLLIFIEVHRLAKLRTFPSGKTYKLFFTEVPQLANPSHSGQLGFT